jgi:hypothetical protein
MAIRSGGTMNGTRTTGADRGGDGETRVTYRRPGLIAGLVTTVLGVALMVYSPFAGSAGAANGVVGDITITQTPGVDNGPCITPAQLTYTTLSDASVFRLRIFAAAEPCAPISATAAIYGMPTGGAQWPQTLKLTKSFTITGPGTTDVVFTKDCTPSQFDVVTGATPQVIGPLGDMHGPLLFPFNTDTAYQDPGAVCEGTTTTSGVTTTTAANATTIATSTSVADTTIVQASSTTTTPTGVLGATTTQPSSVLSESSSNPSSQGSSLAATGVSSKSTAMAGFGMFAAGLVMVAGSRRRILPNLRMITSTASVSDNSPFSTK